jgi:putative RNA 2'-phosphotransferase
MKNTSRKLSYLLRHNPEDLILDKQGWAMTSQLLSKLGIRLTELTTIVETNDKKRFEFNDDKSKIRASQGHSKKLGLDIKFEEVQFPSTYYHGTSKHNFFSIQKSGLNSKTRAYVHLSKDIETAFNVGKRHSKEVIILAIDGNQMKRDGLKIFESENGVILAESVPPKYITAAKDN